MLSLLKSVLTANSQAMGIVSNNIANANSNGFKKSTASFEHLYSSHHSSDPDKFSGMGVTSSDPRLQMSQGSFEATGGALDLAITGQGFFTAVQGDEVDNPFFTRDGSFNIKANGEIITSDGLSVMGFLGEALNGPIQNLVIPTTRANINNTTSLLSNVNVNPRGQITATYGLDTEVIIGSFALSKFTNDPGLSPVGNNRYKQNAKSGAPTLGIPMNGAFGKIEAGNLERSNVDITTEMVNMLKTQQAFTGVSRLLQTEVDITKRLIDG